MVFPDKSNTWVLVANAAFARVYRGPHHGVALTLIENFEHLASRQKDKNLVSGSLGRYKAKDVAGGAYAPRSDPKKNEFDQFARDIAEHLNKAHLANEFQELILIAPGHMQALIKNHCDKNLSHRIVKAVDKDYIQYNEAELNEVVTQLLKKVLPES